MTRFGLKLMTELHDGRTLVRQAQAAEAAGLEFVSISDHFHPWLPEQQHSPFAWTVLGAIATATDLDLATGVTCPIVRYHPAIIAQAAATVASMTDAKLTLGLGAGERLNEHVTGQPFPGVDQRYEMLDEAIDMMRTLWTGEWTTIRGDYFDVDHAKVYEQPSQPIDVALAVSGDGGVELAHHAGVDGIVSNAPDASLVEDWVAAGGDASHTWTEVPCAWAATVDDGLKVAHERFRFGSLGWKVMSELPNPANFDAAAQFVRPDDVGDAIPHGPDPAPFVDAIREFVDAGFEHVALLPVGDDTDGFLRFWTDEILPELR